MPELSHQLLHCAVCKTSIQQLKIGFDSKVEKDKELRIKFYLYLLGERN